MKVSLIIPTLNEEGCIRKVLQEVPRNIVDEVIVVDGSSTDNTVREARKVLKPNDRIIRQKSKGYGGAFLEGFKSASGDIIVMMDGDGSHNPKDIIKIVNKIKGSYEFVMASRYTKGGRSEDDTLIRFIGNKLFTWLTNFIHHTNVSDSIYLFTAITRGGLNKLKLKSHGFEFCAEILIKAHRAGLKFTEVPTIERKRFSGKSKVNAFLHGLKILQMILREYD